MSRLFPKPKPEFEIEYRHICNQNNLRYVWYFSLFTCVVFAFHLIHHFRLGHQALSAEMIPYTLIYSFCIVYPAINMLLLGKLKHMPALQPVTNVIEVVFPYFMAAVAILLSTMSATFGLGITPYAVIMMLMSFVLQGQIVALISLIVISFLLMSVTLYLMTPVEVYSPLIAIAFTTGIACALIANLTENLRIKQFELVSELNESNRKLQHLSQHDHLTSLLNRRAIDRILDRELTRSQRFDHPLSILMLDIDDFKEVNDSRGHVFGDRVIQEVAKTIASHVRDVDYVGRIGGDEFIVILIETDHDLALQIANRMRKEIAMIRIPEDDMFVTISIGHAVSEGESHLALIEKADKALYQAKRAGKNKVRSLHAV